MGDNDYIVIVPLSTIGIAFFAFIFTGLGAIYSIKLWFERNLTTILIVTIIIAISVAIILLIRKGFLATLLSLLGSSQLLFFVIYGALNLPDGNGLAVIWGTIVFLIYAIIAFVNIGIYLIVTLFSILDKKGDWEIFNVFYGGAGWILNLIVLWAVLTG